MTTLNDLERIVPEVKRQLQDISDKMSRYKRIDTDFRARNLMAEIKRKIEIIDKNFEAFKNDLATYGSYNFDNFVNNIRKIVTDSDKIYKTIMKSENHTDHFADSPFKKSEITSNEKKAPQTVKPVVAKPAVEETAVEEEPLQPGE